jgi:hypothetical protein
MSSRLAIAFLTFVIGISLTTVLFFVSRNQNSRESAKIQTVDVCEITSRPGQYEARMVRVRGALVGFHDLVLYEPACKSPNNYIRLDLNQESRVKLVELANRFEDKGLREGNFSLNAELVGRVEAVNDEQDKVQRDPNYPAPITYHTRFVVFSIERIEPLDTN